MPLRSTVALLAVTMGTADAQDRPPPAEALAAKLASPFLRSAPWFTDYDVAKAAATERETLIFGYFTTANH